jgi:probable rRNA maturation factor
MQRLRRRRPNALQVFVTDERGRRVRSAGLAGWLARVAPARARGTVTVALVGDARIRALNRQYRGFDYTTDVLSFPASPGPEDPAYIASARRRVKRRDKKSRPQAPGPSPHLGDIVIARGVARRQARAAGHGDPAELRTLALHGLLHLLGYDHEHDNGEMARLERRLRRKGGLRQGLIER